MVRIGVYGDVNPSSQITFGHPTVRRCIPAHRPLAQRNAPSHVARAIDGDSDVKEVMQRLEESSNLIASNPAFAQVFQNALQRQGVEALTKSQQLAKEKRPSPAEEVLLEALREARRNIIRLENLQKAIEINLEEQQKQFDRVQFALKRANSDAAYIRTLEKIRAQQKETIRSLDGSG